MFCDSFCSSEKNSMPVDSNMVYNKRKTCLDRISDLFWSTTCESKYFLCKQCKHPIVRLSIYNPMFGSNCVFADVEDKTDEQITNQLHTYLPTHIEIEHHADHAIDKDVYVVNQYARYNLHENNALDHLVNMLRNTHRNLRYLEFYYCETCNKISGKSEMTHYNFMGINYYDKIVQI